MTGKGSISRMSDECLMTLETVFPFNVVYQTVMQKFTLASKFEVCIQHLYAISLLKMRKLALLFITVFFTYSLYSVLEFSYEEINLQT